MSRHVRHLVRDTTTQFAALHTLFHACDGAATANGLKISVSRGLSPPISQLHLLVDEVQSEHPDILKAALALFGSANLDFVDCLLVAYNNCLGDRVASFDRKLNRRLK